MSEQATTFPVGQRVRIGGDGNGPWGPYTGVTGTVREISDDPACGWRYCVLTDTGIWIFLLPDEIEPIGDGGTDERGEGT